MVSSKRLIIVLSFMLLALLLSACVSSGEVAPEAEFGVSLPRIVVEIDDNGVPTVAGLSAETLKNLTLGNVDLTWLRMEPLLIQRFMDMGLQHIEALYKDDGLYLFVNGEQLPSFVWDAESLANTTDLATEIGGLDPTFAAALKTILPFVQAVGANVAIQFPTAAGAEVVAMRDMSELPEPETSAAEDEGGFQLSVEVNYDENGMPSVPGAGFIVQNLLGVDISQLALPQETIAQLCGSGISSISISTKGDGLYIFVNDQSLPRISWSPEQLQTGAAVVSELYFPNPNDPIRQVLNTILPALGEVDIEFVLNFPC